MNRPFPLLPSAWYGGASCKNTGHRAPVVPGSKEDHPLPARRSFSLREKEELFSETGTA